MQKLYLILCRFVQDVMLKMIERYNMFFIILVFLSD